MKQSELIRRLKKYGCKFQSHATNHDWWINPENGCRSQIPRHKTQDVPQKTYESILKQLGLK